MKLLQASAASTGRMISSSGASPTKGLIINVVGEDRRGIVSDVSKQVLGVGGNVGESQAAKLGKYFSLMMKVDVPDENVDKLSAVLLSSSELVGLSSTMFEIGDNGAAFVDPEIGCTYSHMSLYRYPYAATSLNNTSVSC